MYERDEREPPLDLIRKFADFFGVTTDYLFGRTDVRNGVTPNKNDDISPEEREFLKWVEENLEGAFFYEFSKTPEEQKEEAMETLKLWWEMEKRRAERRRKKGEE
jgi:transcriptional regulator with XRE-family HTH domain